MVKKWLSHENFSADNKGRKTKQGLKILRFLSKAEHALSLPVIAENIKLSVPTVTRLMADLKSQDLVVEEGKKETESGRKPVIYSIKKSRFYSVGVEILLGKIQVVVSDLDFQTVFASQNSDFILENTEDCRNYICNFIKNTIAESKISFENILGIGVGITGRVNSLAGKTYNFFEFGNISFADYLAQKLNQQIIVENDTRAVGLLESVAGKAKNVDNAVIVNISSGIGMTLIANQKMLTGKSGFAGEFGHMQFAGNENRLCICGKRGCLDTEVSGKALETSLKEAFENGEHSLLSEKGSVHYDEIITAANDGDFLSISLLQKQGEKLGFALGNVVNLLNPERIIISGKYAGVEDFFRNSVKTGLYKTGLKDPLADCKIVNSELSTNSGCVGAAALIFKKYDLI